MLSIANKVVTTYTVGNKALTTYMDLFANNMWVNAATTGVTATIGLKTIT